MTGEIDPDKHTTDLSGGQAESVPVIDIGDLDAGVSASGGRSVDQIAEAARIWGFFQIVNHGISEALIDRMWRNTSAFFAQSMESKEVILRTRDNPWGYYNNELTKNQRDKKEVFDYTTKGTDSIYKASNRWPDFDPQFRAVMEEYRDACIRLSLQLLEAFSCGLGLPPDFLNARFDPLHTGFVRLNHYPVKDPLQGRGDVVHMESADLGVHHHTDAGALTVLLQDDVGGLQVHRDGHWHDVPTVQDALVINTGDMMQVWSNDIYHAATHRVLAMDANDRYSIPFFYNPAAGTRVSPLSTVVTDKNPAHYHTIDWSEYRGKRTDGDYADCGSEVQISRFRITEQVR